MSSCEIGTSLCLHAVGWEKALCPCRTVALESGVHCQHL